jgi:2-hydroxy-3-keto-5-methylthiopentenyl-1-phosphate phosphatase
MNCHVFVDFDGTIVPEDATNKLLDRFAPASWLDIEEEWQSGRIGSRECMERQIDLIRARPEELDVFLAGVRIDPAFSAFVDICRRNFARVTVVSDGMDRSVRTVLKAAKIDLPFFANRLEWLGGDRWRLAFPHAKDDCTALMGNCKCAVARGPASTVRIMIGDGRSDFCIASSAHFVLAKDKLLDHCRLNDLPHMAFKSFTDANRIISQWFAQQEDGTIQARPELAEGAGGKR